tara:strand:+ start:396 stop:791 length:396 start_codon:yes stop_codon:yes gene_type:complete
MQVVESGEYASAVALADSWNSDDSVNLYAVRALDNPEVQLLLDPPKQLPLIPPHRGWRDEGSRTVGVHSRRPLAFANQQDAEHHAKLMKDRYGRGFRVRCEPKSIQQDGARLTLYVVTVRDTRKRARTIAW